MNQANRALFFCHTCPPPPAMPYRFSGPVLLSNPPLSSLRGPRPINRKCVASKPTFNQRTSWTISMDGAFFLRGGNGFFWSSCSHPLYVDISQTTIFFVSQSQYPSMLRRSNAFIFGVLLDFDGVFCSENIHYHVVSAHLSAVKYFSGSVEERGACLSSGLEVTRYVSPVVLSLNTSLYSIGTALSTSAE